MLVDTVAFIAYGFLTSGFWALAFTPIAAASGIAGPALQGILSNSTPDDQQGELQGVLSSLSAVAMALSPLVMTAIFSVFTRPGVGVYAPGAPFLLSACLMGICVAILVIPARVKAHSAG